MGTNNMIITRFEEAEKSRVNIFIDEEYSFFLYQREIEDFNLSEGCEISSQLYEEIKENIVYRRAQNKALAVLKFMDRTKQELRAKLIEAGYTEDITDMVIEYASSYGYLNDERYAASYVRSRMNSKSKLVIRLGLLQKGIDRDIADRVMQEEYGYEETEDPEISAIRKAVSKKTDCPESLTYEERQKLTASLYRKGFDINKINHILS